MAFQHLDRTSGQKYEFKKAQSRFGEDGIGNTERKYYYDLLMIIGSLAQMVFAASTNNHDVKDNI